jgi:hypothetical protein
MSNLYKETYRGYLIDHHSPDPPIVTLDKLDAKEYEKFYTTANINSLMVYFKDHWGVTYYDSKVGKRHPGLTRDWNKEIAAILKKKNIEFIAYYCLEYDTYAPQAHPEWSIRDADGTARVLAGRMAKWGMACYETGYRDYCLTQLSEIVSGYNPDSLFLDIFGKSLCYCPACKKKFKDMYGYNLPEEEKDLKEKHNDITEFLDQCAEDMLKDIIDLVKSIDPTIKVTINFAALYNKRIRDMLDYQFTEPWAGNWLSAAYARDTAIGQYPQLGPGNVSEVYDYKPQNIYTLAAAQIASQGCRVSMYSGSQHPDGTLEHEEAVRIGNAYREVEKFEDYLSDREVVSDIGIIQSDTASRIKASTTIIPNAIGRLRSGDPHRDGVLGAMKVCDYSKYTWNVIPEQEVTSDTVKDYKILILPNVYYVSDSLKKTLESFVSNGGTLITAGGTSLYDKEGNIRNNFSLSSLYGCNFTEIFTKYKSSRWGSYLDMQKDALWKHMAETYPPVGSIRYHVTGDAKPLAFFVNPATELTDEKWVNWWCPPPSQKTGYPAVLENIWGNGRVIYFAFDIFEMENDGFNHVRNLFKGTIEKVIAKPKVWLDTKHPNAVGMVSYDRPKNKELIIHLVSHMAELSNGDAPEVEPGSLNISSDWRYIKKINLVYPYQKELAFDKKDRIICVELPPTKIHQVIQLKY